MVDSLALNFSKKATSHPDSVFYNEYCGYCFDLGYIESEGITAPIFEEIAFIEFRTERACTNCTKGRIRLAEWQKENNCACAFGWTKEYVVEKTPGGRMVETTVVANCAKCGTGRRLSQVLEAKIFTRKQDRLNKLMANSGLSEEILSMSFDNFMTDEDKNPDMAKAKRAVKNAAEVGNSIMLMGNPGRGKTHLAASYLNHWMQERGKTGLFVSLVDLMASLRRTIRATEGPDWDTLLDRYIQADLLVLDDLGQEKASEKVIEVVFHLLNSRINQRKPTVITTNYSLKLLASDCGYPPSICSRLASFDRITWDAPDYRLNRFKVVGLWDSPVA
jgi:DNA replication protein DnaC